MSKINDLITALCPDGVPFRRLGDIGFFYGGLTGKSKDDFKDGNAVLITYMNVYANIELKTDVEDRVRIGEKEKQNTVQYGDVLFTGSSETPDECGMSSVLTTHTDEKLYLNSFCFGYRFTDPDMFLPGFTKHLFRSNDLRYQLIRTANGVTRFNVSKKKMEDVTIPVLPIEVQREIVRILDNFTELAAELTAELTARKKQYDYYRNNLLSFDKSTPRMSIKELCNISAGGDAPKNEMSKVKTEEYQIPIISNGIGENALYGYTNTPKITEPAVTIAARGTIGYAEYRDYPYFPIVRLLSVIPKDKSALNTRYLYYCLKDKEYKVPNGGIPQLTVPMIADIEVPIPSIAIQGKIVDILDKFDMICTDLYKGLPSEINARQKQYEYYRDKLLSFKEVS